MDINARLRNHIDTLFCAVPQNTRTQEFKEEMLRNLTEKYYDLIAQGKSEETAYSIAIASIGDISGLLEAQRPQADLQAMQKQRNKSAVLTAVAVMLYILSIVPGVLFSMSDNYSGYFIGAVLMFIIIAVATGLLIYNQMSKPKYMKTNDTMVEEFKEWQSGKERDNSVLKSVKAAIWSITVLVYLALSFFTGAWQYTWMLFLVAVAVDQIINLCINIRKK